MALLLRNVAIPASLVTEMKVRSNLQQPEAVDTLKITGTITTTEIEALVTRTSVTETIMVVIIVAVTRGK